MAESKVKVLLQLDDETEERWIQVKVHSARKPAFSSYYNLPFDAQEKHVEAAGAVLAERVNGQVDDNLDPGECARKAVEAFKEAKARFEEEWRKMTASGGG